MGIFGRPFLGEARSGDHGGFRRRDDTLALAVCDGLGHGVLAREAAVAAIDVFGHATSLLPKDILEACNAALTGTRGAVMAAAIVGETDGTFELASMGDVSVEAVAPRARRRFGGVSFVLGSLQAAGRARAERVPIDGEAILMFTDGITSSMTIENDLALLREHPIIVAHQVVTRFGRDNDDVLVLMAR